MSRLFRMVTLALSVGLSSGCASIVSGTNQSVSVTSAAPTGADVAGAKCTLVNDKGSWFLTTPASVTVHRSYQDLAVNCTLDGFEPGVTSVKSSTKGMAAGNILFGGIIGAGVDVSTGAAYDYPNLIRVTMGQAGAATVAPAGATSVPAAATVVAIATPRAAAVPTNLVAAGTRISFLDVDPVSGSPLGESSYVITEIEPGGAITFNDGSIVVKADGTPTKGALHSAMIYGWLPDQLRRGGTWSGRFRAPSVAADVPVELSVIGPQEKVISGRKFDAVRLRVEGYATRENVTAIGSAGGAKLTGEMLVDRATGLVLEVKVTSRHPSYNLQRELIRVAGT